jgi:ACS family tartrate transporter-like MFS transporter
VLSSEVRERPHSSVLAALKVSRGHSLPVCLCGHDCVGAHVDQRGRRVVNMAVACFLRAAGLVAPVLSDSLAVALIEFSVALVGVIAARAIFWAIPTRFLTGVAAAGGLAFINSIGTVGGFVGPSMMGWLREFSGSYIIGLTAVAAIMIAATVASMSLKLVGSKE